MPVNMQDLMSRSSSAAASALGLRYAGVTQPPALDFIAPMQATQVAAKKAVEDAIEPVRQASFEATIRGIDRSNEQLMKYFTIKNGTVEADMAAQAAGEASGLRS